MSQPCSWDGCEEVNITKWTHLPPRSHSSQTCDVVSALSKERPAGGRGDKWIWGTEFPWRAFICTKRHLLCVLPSWGRHHFKSSLHLLVIFHAYCVVIHAVYTVPAAMWQPHFSTGIKHIKWVSYVSDTQSVPEVRLRPFLKLSRMSTHFLIFKVVFQHLSKYFFGHWLLFPLIFSPVLVPCVSHNRQANFFLAVCCKNI